jgi:glucose-1-phosphate cytidylyltransferase
MKVLILAGGSGTRLSEETSIRPKPMVEIGNKPILWHIMKSYAHFGLTEFVILGGYKVEVIRQYFLNYTRVSSDITIDLATGDIVWLRAAAEPWRVTVLDTGLDTMTGGRIKRAQDAIGNETFCLTYGDGVGDVNMTDLLEFHRRCGVACTVTAVVPAGRFGVLGLTPDSNKVTAFREKDSDDVGLVNGGFYVCEPSVFDVIDDDLTVWEQQPMSRLVERGQLAAFRHNGFWLPMDTLRDKMVLEHLWGSGKAPWKVWD